MIQIDTVDYYPRVHYNTLISIITTQLLLPPPLRYVAACDLRDGGVLTCSLLAGCFSSELCVYCSLPVAKLFFSWASSSVGMIF